ncbi:MAG: hypothetical protein U0531_17620 [Dehalococcoidia bacterium]
MMLSQRNVMANAMNMLIGQFTADDVYLHATMFPRRRLGQLDRDLDQGNACLHAGVRPRPRRR